MHLKAFFIGYAFFDYMLALSVGHVMGRHSYLVSTTS
jgi:hypothetical protein